MRYLLAILFFVVAATVGLLLVTQPYYYFTTVGLTFYHTKSVVISAVCAWGILGLAVSLAIPVNNK